jgi:hypothetical protein
MVAGRKKGSEMTQHITQEQAVELSIKAGDEFAIHEAEFYTNLCNAAIQHYIDQRAKDLSELPPTKLYKDANGVLHPTAAHCRTTAEMEAYGQQCAAQARELALSEAIAICRRNAQNTSADELEALKGK